MDCEHRSGHIEGIRRALEPYVGRSARIVWDDGTSEVLTIVSVDGEGFVYELIPLTKSNTIGKRLPKFRNC